MEHYEREYTMASDIIRYADGNLDELDKESIIEAMNEKSTNSGKYVRLFEKKFAEYIGMKYCVLVNSGSSANFLALASLDLKHNHEVITCAAGFPTTLNPIIQLGLTPVLIDSDCFTLNTTQYYIKKAITHKTKAVIIPHTLGNPFKLDIIKEICVRNRISLIEDTCDALGSRYNGQICGSFGDLSTFSFYPAHHLSMQGGGAILTNNEDYYKKIISLRDWGRECWCSGLSNENGFCGNRLNYDLNGIKYDHRYIYSNIGYNLRFPDILASIGIKKIDNIEINKKTRKENFDFLYSILTGYKEIILPDWYKEASPNWFAFPITCNGIDRNDLQIFLEKNGVETRCFFAGNLIRQPAYKNIRLKTNEFKGADAIMKNTFFVGLHQGLNKDHMYKIGTLIISYIGEKTNAQNSCIPK